MRGQELAQRGGVVARLVGEAVVDGHRLDRAVDHAEVVGPEQLLVILPRRFGEFGVEPDPGVVDPGVDTAEPVWSQLSIRRSALRSSEASADR